MAIDAAALRRTVEAQRHSSGDAHGVSVKPSHLLALLDIAEGAEHALALLDDPLFTWIAARTALASALHKAEGAARGPKVERG